MLRWLAISWIFGATSIAFAQDGAEAETVVVRAGDGASQDVTIPEATPGVTANIRIRVELGPVPAPPSTNTTPEPADAPAAEAPVTVGATTETKPPVLIPAWTPPPLPRGRQAYDSERPSFAPRRRRRDRGPRLRLGGPIVMISAGATMALTGVIAWDESSYDETYGYGYREPNQAYLVPILAGAALGVGGIAFLLRRVFARRRARRAQQRLRLTGASATSLNFSF